MTQSVCKKETKIIMNRYLLGAGVAVLALIGLKVYEANAEPFVLHVSRPLITTQIKVFHHNTAVDNGDACTTPQEAAEALKGKAEIRNQVSGDAAVKLKEAVKRAYPGTTDENLQWDEMDAYLTTDPQSGLPVISILLFSKDATGTLCIVGGGYMPVDAFDTLIIDAGIVSKASNLHLGYEGNPGKFVHNGKID